MTTVEQRDRAHERRRRSDFVWTELLPKNPPAACKVPGATPGAIAALQAAGPGFHPDPALYDRMASQIVRQLAAVSDDLLPRTVAAYEPEFIDLILPAPVASAFRDYVVFSDIPKTSAASFKHCSDPHFPSRVICRVLELNGAPLTAYEIVREVLKRCPNLRARATLERRVRKLAAKGVLREVDCAGVSPDGAPCWRYELVRAAA